MIFVLALLTGSALAGGPPPPNGSKECSASHAFQLSTAQERDCGEGNVGVKYGNISDHALCQAFANKKGVSYEAKAPAWMYTNCAYQGAPTNRVNPVQAHLAGGSKTHRVCVPCYCRQSSENDCPRPVAVTVRPSFSPTQAPIEVTVLPSMTPTAPPVEETVQMDTCKSDPESPPDSCWCNHAKDTRCNKHKTKEACLNNYNYKAGGPGISMLEQICGWSVNNDKFGGLDSGNCRSKPFITRKKWVPIADFGACQLAVEEESGQKGPDGSGGAVPTMPPTCAMCSMHDDMKKDCFKANENIEKYCVDACLWNKKNDKCEDFACSQFTEDGMIKCEKKSKKIFAQEELQKSAKYKSMCYFNANTEECQASIPDLECRDYNRDGLKKKKKACKKLPKFQGKKCVYDSKSKQCRGPDQKTECTQVKKTRTCEKKLDHCWWDLTAKSCKHV